MIYLGGRASRDRKLLDKCREGAINVLSVSDNIKELRCALTFRHALMRPVLLLEHQKIQSLIIISGGEASRLRSGTILIAKRDHLSLTINQDGYLETAIKLDLFCGFLRF